MLHETIRDHVKLEYDEVWNALEQTDSDPENRDNIILFYSRRSEKKKRRDSGSGDNDAWNREHVWPKSHGFPKKSPGPYTDLHLMRPAHRTVNSSRGRKDFDDSERHHAVAKGAKIDSDSFEPPDAVKGDAARMIFYMAVRYEGGICEPDLTILKTDSESDTPTFCRLCTLLSWHRKDSVNLAETLRNDRVEAIPGNRIPFIDRPEWADAIWGHRCPNGQAEP